MADHLRPVLYSSGKVGRFYFSGDCPKAPGTLDQQVFPKVKLREPLNGVFGIDAVRSIFRDQPHVRITEEQVGLIRVRVGKVADTILQTRITNLNLDAFSQYNAILAVFAIERASEVQSTMSKLDVHVPIHVLNYLMVKPQPGIPHLPERLSDFTMDEALDLVARTWNGVVSYGSCKHFIDVNFHPNDFFFYVNRNWPGFSPQSAPSCAGSPCLNPAR